MSRWLLVGLFPVAGLAAVVGCALDWNLPSEGGGIDGGTDVATDAMGAADGDTGALTDGGDTPCPGEAGAAMVRVGGYCVDSTEVTVDDYKRFLIFLSSADASAPTPSSGCSYKTNHFPCGGSQYLCGDAGVWPNDNLLQPVRGIDWCDAWAYCAWAGKRLCGAIGGGSLSSVDAGTDPAQSMWLSACTRGGAQAFPYGSTYAPNACNTRDRAGNAGPMNVGSLASCTGGSPGIFDMVGNVYEWIDACDSTSMGATCVAIGGAYTTNSGGVGVPCATSDKGTPRTDNHDGNIGTRCCAP